MRAFLQEEGYKVDTCYNGDSALEQFYNKSYHLVILDILLPGMSGKELLKEFRKISNIPVLMVTALADDQHQLDAFNYHADDYVIKPFSMPILIKRVEALLRRSGFLQNEISAGGIVLFPESYKAVYDSQEIPLTPREFEILLLLANNKGKVISHETILTKIWGYAYIGDDRIIHTYIKNLRSKLPINIIKTIRSVGYSLTDEAL
jgi:two-component system response regulator VanR